MILTNTVASAYDPRDYKFIASVAPQAHTDLRVLNRDIEDQGSLGACTAFALVNNIEILTEKAGQWENLSNLFQYYITRSAEGILDKEGAYSIKDCLEVGRKIGFCLESEWPYIIDKENIKPDSTSYESAAARKIIRYESLDISNSLIFGTDPQRGIDSIKSALAEGLPVVIAMALGQKFRELKGPLSTQKYCVVDIPDYPSNNNPYIGGHAMTIVGNDDTLGGFIVENQWGTAWGDKGYCLIPYNVIRDFSEAWVIRAYKDITTIDPVLQATRSKVIKLFVAILGRSPKLSGFKWYVNEFMNGANIPSVAQGIIDSDECKAKYTNSGGVVYNVIESVEAFNNRVAVAEYCVVDLACDKLEVAKAALDGVTADPLTVDIAKYNLRRKLFNGTL